MEQGEVFDLNAAQITAADTMYFDKDSEKHMRELLSGAIGDGEDDDEGGHADMVHVEGLGEGVTLMPHQVRGVMWLKKREAAQNYGGILADVSLASVSGGLDVSIPGLSEGLRLRIWDWERRYR
jgi:SNF2 family DNA or RNA helicase